MDYQQIYQDKVITKKEIAQKINSGDVIYMSPAVCAPIHLMQAIGKRKDELTDVHVYSVLLLYPFEFLGGEFRGHINYHSFFMGPLERNFVPQGNIEINSVHFSKVGYMIENVIKPNVVIMECTPPDENGMMNFGPIGAAANALPCSMADTILVQVNKNLPRCCGEDNEINVKDVSWIMEKDHEIAELPQPETTDVDRAIAANILPQIPDGACIQIGLGGVANAVGFGLESKKNLSIHTEMLTDSMVYLIKKGAINPVAKNYMPNKLVCGFGIGNEELYKFMDGNEMIHCAPIWKVNNPDEIAKNDNFISINTALMVDLTGQVGAESIGYNQFSCTGGAFDFVEGSCKSKGGKSFICIASTVNSKTEGLKSRITITLPPGTAVTTPRASVQYIVTEYGIADLYNKSIPQRVHALIAVAHPDFRDELLAQAREKKLIFD